MPIKHYAKHAKLRGYDLGTIGRVESFRMVESPLREDGIDAMRYAINGIFNRRGKSVTMVPLSKAKLWMLHTKLYRLAAEISQEQRLLQDEPGRDAARLSKTLAFRHWRPTMLTVLDNAPDQPEPLPAPDE